jgi:hypothetical protein
MEQNFPYHFFRRYKDIGYFRTNSDTIFLIQKNKWDYSNLIKSANWTK